MAVDSVGKIVQNYQFNCNITALVAGNLGQAVVQAFSNPSGMTIKNCTNILKTVQILKVMI